LEIKNEKIIKLGAIFLVITMSISVFAATIGQQLPEKENGWERYDDINPYIQYKDFPYWNFKGNATNGWGYGGTTSLNANNFIAGEVKFKFIGTQFN